MINQLKVAFFKLRRFWLFYIVAVILAAAGFSCGYLVLRNTTITSNGKIVFEPYFREIASDTSFIFLISLVSGWFAGNDFGNRTIHNEIKIGYSRASVLWTRFIAVSLSASLLHLIYIVSGTLGFGMVRRVDGSVFSIGSLCQLFVVLLQIVTIQSMIILITFLLRRTAAVISASVCFSFISCNVLRNFFADSRVFMLSPFWLCQSNSPDDLIPAGIFAGVLLAGTLTATWYIFRKAEIR